jgi:hypothetical protein
MQIFRTAFEPMLSNFIENLMRWSHGRHFAYCDVRKERLIGNSIDGHRS